MHKLAAVVALALAAATLAPSSLGQSGEVEVPFEFTLEGRAESLGLTVQEYEAIEQMQNKAAETIVSEVNDNPGAYGGVYFDTPTLEFVVQYIGPMQRPLTNPHAITFKSVRVERSIAQLTDVREGVIESLGERGDLVSVGIDVQGNVVKVVARNVPDVAASVAQWGDAVRVERGEFSGPDSCTSRINCRPFRGGIEMSLLWDEDGHCSFGFYARRTVNNNLVAITAGHCGSKATGDIWYHSPTKHLIGTTKANTVNTNHGIDALRLKVEGSQATQPYNRVYSTDSEKSIPIKGSFGHNNTFVGQWIRKAGASSGMTVGQVTDLHHLNWWNTAGTWMGNNITYSWVYKHSAYQTGGDSGGTVWVHASSTGTGTLLGIVQGSGPSGYYFTHQKNIRDVLEVTPCFTDAC